jgi:hypothetical protein
MAQKPDHPKTSLTKRTLLALMLAWFLTNASIARADTTASKEYQVKAAFLLNFAQFIQWPAENFAAPETPIAVGVLGDDPFGSALEQTFHGESINGRQLVVKRSRKIEDLKTCHMIFISSGEKDRIADAIKSLGDASVLTVGETDQFVQRGGIINLYMDNGKVRFEVNAGEAQRKGLKIHSQLLKRAKIVGLDSDK